jgi:hypothetical protein
MLVLRIEHPVDDYEAWKRAFDGDPLDRKGSGVRSYRVMRGVDDPRLVTVDLAFDDRDAAESMRAALLGLWERIRSTGLVGDQQLDLLDVVGDTAV